MPLPEKAYRVLTDPPLGQVRYRVLYGGRGGAKSWSMARALLALGVTQPLRIVCAREHQVSIRESVHHLLADQITELGLGWHYDVGEYEITGKNGTTFLFRGLYHVRDLKSLEAAQILWIEEAESVSEESWRTVVPTIRTAPHEIWVSFNPQLPDDPTYQRFLVQEQDSVTVAHMTLADNPWCPPILIEEARQMLATDPELHAHIYGGETLARSNAQILAGKLSIRPFTPGPQWDGPYYGADWGWQDPATIVRCWIGEGALWVEYEAGGIHQGVENLTRLYDDIPGTRAHTIRADDARPETIKQMRDQGFAIVAAEKWPGSVEDGIRHLNSYQEIVIHPRCPQVAREGRLWRWKLDLRTKDPLPIPASGNDHYWDAVRYALAPIIRTTPQSRVVRVRYA